MKGDPNGREDFSIHEQNSRRGRSGDGQTSSTPHVVGAVDSSHRWLTPTQGETSVTPTSRPFHLQII